jgi:hypothetical protein
VKRTSTDEPVGVVIHICMETIQGNSLCSYLYLKFAKNAMYLLLSFMYFLLQNQRTRGQNRFCPVRRVGIGGKRLMVEKGVRGSMQCK